jgi:hypothetical protein
MKIKRHKFQLLFFLLLLIEHVFSQSPDTIVIYEYIYKTDTVWLEAKPIHDTIIIEKLERIENASLILNAQDMKADLRINSSTSCATIPIKSIILSENNKNLESMKKLTFLGLTFLAVNSSLFAQDRPGKSIGIYLRANSVFQQRIYPEVEWYKYSNKYKVSIFEVTPSLGIKGNLPLSSSLSLSPRISYLQVYGLINDHSMGMKMVENVPRYSRFSGVNFNSSLKLNGYDLICPLYSESPTSKFHFLSTDILLNYYFLKGEKMNGRIYGGVRINFLLAQSKDSVIPYQINTNYERIVFDYTGGLGFDFRKRVYFEVEYSRNINSFVNTSQLKVNLGTASLNLGYYLFKK